MWIAKFRIRKTGRVDVWFEILCISDRRAGVLVMLQTVRERRTGLVPLVKWSGKARNSGNKGKDPG